MITLILSGRTTPSRPRAEALAHLKRVHGPLVYDAPADAGAMPSVYVQNHVLGDLTLPPSLHDAQWDRDLVTEISFEDVAHLQASTASPYYLENLKPDEGRFVDQDSVKPLVVITEISNISGSPGVIKLFVYLKAAGDLDAFDNRWRSAQVTSRDACAKQSASRPLRKPGTPPAFVDGVWSLWFADVAGAETFCVDRLPALLASFDDTLDHTASRIVLAEEFSVSRLRQENSAYHSETPAA